MSCSLPPEILDFIIDLLRDEPTTLNACCVVSKSWIQRTRKHLFVDIKFHPPGRRVCRWRETFPDPLDSPAHHTQILSIRNPQLITGADTGTIRTFCGVERLTVDTDLWHDQWVSLTPLRGFSSVLRSLHLSFTSLPDSEVFGLICSLPLLEDLALVSRSRRRGGGWNTPSTSPKLTGSLELRMVEGIHSATYRLLDLPNGLHFTKIAVAWVSKEDAMSTMYLVSRCSNTLESLDIANHLWNTSEVPSIDLSEITKLQDVVFRCRNPGVQWITTALHTANPENLRRISLDLHHHASRGEGWSDLDCLLVQFWISYSVRLKVTCESIKGWDSSRDRVARLLPELTKRGIIDLVEHFYVREDFPGPRRLI